MQLHNYVLYKVMDKKCASLFVHLSYFFAFCFRAQVLEMFEHAYGNYMVCIQDNFDSSQTLGLY